MNETVVKMVGLACMVMSIFAVFFGIYIPAAGSLASPMLVATGLILFLLGVVLYVVVRKD